MLSRGIIEWIVEVCRMTPLLMTAALVIRPRARVAVMKTVASIGLTSRAACLVVIAAVDRLMSIECPEICPCGDKCSNQRYLGPFRLIRTLDSINAGFAESNASISMLYKLS